MIDCVNYVVTHKEYPIRQDIMYRTLCVGTFRKPNALSEQDGENISQYNNRLNECTALYWIWKNTQHKYVGLSHYRRWFYNNHFPGDRSRLDMARTEELLCHWGYDIILTDMIQMQLRLRDNVAMAVGQVMADRGYEAFLHAIREKQPEYADAFVDVMNSNRMFVCNLFVTSKKLLDQYCEWLFSFLLDATDAIDIAGCSPKQRRTAGYYAEIMWTVWMRRQDSLKYYELPYQWTEG